MSIHLLAPTRALLAVLVGGFVLFATGCTQPPEGGPPPSDANRPVPVSADGEEEADAEPAMVARGDAVHGEELYVACASCHGPDARGVPGLGKSLHDNDFMRDMTDDEVVEFLEVGRPADHELNSTGVAMPGKGGNPTLTDDDLYDIVAFMRTLE